MRERSAWPLVIASTMAASMLIAAQPQDGPRQYLRFTDKDLAALARGEVVTRSTAVDNRELFCFGAVRVRVTADHFVARFRDIVSFKQSAMVLQIGVMSQTPSESDLASLRLDPGDVEALRKCRIGDCDLRLTEAAIERVRREAGPPHAREFPERAAQVMRAVLLDEVRAYMAGGATALADYRDGRTPLSRLETFRRLRRDSPYLLEHQPEIYRFLEGYPRAETAGVEDQIYWSREKFGLKPVISLTHLVIHRPADRPSVVFTASRQIYASHYFDGSLGLSALVEASPDASDRYLLYANRSRLDTFTGLFGGLARSIAQRRIRESMAENVRITKERLER